MRFTACVAAMLALSTVFGGVQPEIIDDFDAVDLDPRWEWYTPYFDADGDPFANLGGGFLTIGFPGGAYDSWVGFDRMPRLRMTDFETEEDFVLETFLSVEAPAGAEYYHTGLWVEFQDRQQGVVDGWFHGFYSRQGWQGNHTIRAERVGHWSTPSADDFAVPWGLAEGFLRVERTSDSYSFSYKEADADPWELLHIATSSGEIVTHVGIFAKNWGSDAAVEASYDFFRLSDPDSMAPTLAQPGDALALVGLNCCMQITLLTGFPTPTWDVSVAPAPATPPVIDADGRVDWTPGAADADSTFTFTATATNDRGSDSVSWDVAVTDEIRDDFDVGPDLEPELEFHTPQTGPTLAIDGGGYARLFHDETGDDGLNYDSWSSVDRMPRIRTPISTCGDFAVETVMTLVDATVGGIPTQPSDFHTGIWIRFAGSSLDGLLYGPYRSGQNLRLEKIGKNMPQSDLAILDAEELGLRVERRGDVFRFLYREGAGGQWIEHWSQAYPGAAVTHAGLYSKNWGTPAAVTAEFDYLRVYAPQPAAPILEDPCPDDDNYATVGAAFVKAIAYTPGTPLPTTITLTGPGIFDPLTGLYTFTPAATGEVPVTITAEMAGQPPVSLSFSVCVTSQDTKFEEFDVLTAEDLVPPWELYNPAFMDPPPFSITGGAFQIEVPGGTTFDHWSTVDVAPQLRLSSAQVDLTGSFTIETQLTLASYTAGESFHTGIAVGYGPFEMFYWGPYAGTNVRLERSGVQNLIQLDNVDETMNLRITRDCTDTLFVSYKPLNGDWLYAGAFDVPQAWLDTPDELWVGTIIKTWGTGAQVTATFDYFDILAGDCGGGGPEFKRGDSNGDGGVNIADAVYILQNLFASGPEIACRDAADSNDDEAVNIADAVYILQNLFASGPAIPAPGPDACGPDANPETPDLGCITYTECK